MIDIRAAAGAACACLVLTGVQTINGTPAYAAVSECLDEMSGKTVEHKAEIEAKKQALADWVEKAGKLGPGYTRWQIAYNRRLDCSKSAAGFSCQAVGRPCTIKQVPPAGAVPIKRGVP